MSSAKIIGQPIVSLEYFPPRGLSSERSLMTGAHALRRFSPAYQTVTFGAGGSETDGSFDWSVRLQNLNEVPTAAHIALCHFSRESLIRFAEDLWEQGIERLVVLRGDAGGDGSGDLAGFKAAAIGCGERFWEAGDELEIVEACKPERTTDIEALLNRVEESAGGGEVA